MSSKIRHQVFISSTYQDLIDARRAVQQKILEMDCIPAGMELFSAGNEDSWSLIKSVIDESDYYLLIIAGRYGSLTPEGISFTEKEYDYAHSKNKPVMIFLHEDPGNIPSKLVESDLKTKNKLSEFIAKVSRRHLHKKWSTPSELAGHVASSLFQIRQQYPTDGWVRGDQAFSIEEHKNIERMRETIQALEATNKSLEAAASPSNTLSSGSASVIIPLSKRGLNRSIHATWDEIFLHLGPSLRTPLSTRHILRRLDDFCYQKLRDQVDISWREFNALREPEIAESAFKKIIHQFHALQLIKVMPVDSLSDIMTHVVLMPFRFRGRIWVLTSDGRDELYEKQAIKHAVEPVAL